MQFAAAFPFLIVVILIYNLIVFLSATALGDTVLSVPMMSGRCSASPSAIWWSCSGLSCCSSRC